MPKASRDSLQEEKELRQKGGRDTERVERQFQVSFVFRCTEPLIISSFSLVC